MHDTLRELATALEQPYKVSFTRCRVEALTGERCDWHKADYGGSPRCGWAGMPDVVAQLQQVLDKLNGSDGPVAIQELKLLMEYRPGLLNEVAGGLGVSPSEAMELQNLGRLTWADVRLALAREAPGGVTP